MKKFAPQFWVAAAGVGMTLLGLIGPWVKVFSFVSVSISGFDTGDGKLAGVLVLCAAAALVLYGTDRIRRVDVALVLGVIFGLLITAVGVYDLIHISSRISGSGLTASVGWGLYATVLGGLAISAGSLGTLIPSRKQRITTPDLTPDEIHLGVEMVREAR